MPDNSRRRYFIGPHPSGGVIAGLRSGQLWAGALGIALLWPAMNMSGSVSAPLIGSLPFAVAATLLDVAAVVLLAFFPFQGRSLVEWLPIMGRYGLSVATRTVRFRTTGHVWGSWAEPLPEKMEDAEEIAPPRVVISLPAELAEIEILETTLPSGIKLGVAKDRQHHTFTAVVRTEARSFHLLSPEEQELKLALYGGLLVAFAEDRSPVTRLQWLERTSPAAEFEFRDYLEQNMRPDVQEGDVGLEATRQLLERHTGTEDSHEVLVAITVDAIKGSKLASKRGDGDDGMLKLVGQQVGHLATELHRAGVMSTRPLGARDPAYPSARGLAKIIRDGCDPFSKWERDEHGGEEAGIPVTDFGPIARDTYLDHTRIDGTLHATGWIREWPRVDCLPNVLQPLIVVSGVTRSFSMVMEIHGQDKAISRAERASLRSKVDRRVKTQMGRMTTARDRHREQSVELREHEIARGHASVNFAGYVTVSVPASSGTLVLDEQFAQVQSQARRHGLKLDRLYGQQQDGFTHTLPLGRGLL